MYHKTNLTGNAVALTSGMAKSFLSKTMAQKKISLKKIMLILTNYKVNKEANTSKRQEGNYSRFY